MGALFPPTLPVCHPLSCCHRRSASPLAAPLHTLVRLLLASDAQELLPHQQPRLLARLDAAWERLHTTLQRAQGVSQARAQQLGEQLLTALLREDCCRLAVYHCVPLAQALGVAATTGCRLRWAARVQVLKGRVGRRNKAWHAY